MTQTMMMTKRALWTDSLVLSRIRPWNVCNGGVACTLNTRYENASINDYHSLAHFPKTCVMYVYETE